MDAMVVGATLLGSFAAALALQRIALEALFRALDPARRTKE